MAGCGACDLQGRLNQSQHSEIDDRCEEPVTAIGILRLSSLATTVVALCHRLHRRVTRYGIPPQSNGFLSVSQLRECASPVLGGLRRRPAWSWCRSHAAPLPCCSLWPRCREPAHHERRGGTYPNPTIVARADTVLLFLRNTSSPAAAGRLQHEPHFVSFSASHCVTCRAKWPPGSQAPIPSVHATTCLGKPPPGTPAGDERLQANPHFALPWTELKDVTFLLSLVLVQASVC